MIFQALGNTVRHLTTSRTNVSLQGKQTVCPTFPFCLPICLFYNDRTFIVSVLRKNQKWCGYSQLVGLGPSFPFPFSYFFSLLYVCCHYILYYFLLTYFVFNLTSPWYETEHISPNILPLATYFYFVLFSSAVSISNDLLPLHLSLILSSSSIFSGFLPFTFFLHGESFSFPPLTLLSSLFALLLSFTLSPFTFSPA